MFVQGITVFRAKGTLARGNTHFLRSSAHLRSRPGKAPTFRALPSRPKSTPRRPQGFGNPPKAGVASGKFPTRQRCLPCGPTGCLFLNTQLGRVSPYEYEASPPLSGLCQIWCVACRNRPTNHLILNLDP